MEIGSFSDFFNEIIEIEKKVNLKCLDQVIEILEDGLCNDRMIFTFGNGGSSAAASHFCEDLGKGTLFDLEGKKRFKVMSLTDNLPYILAWANDHGYETIFEQQLRNFASSGDIAIGISGSGNSENVIRAIQYANEIGMTSVGFTGYDGGQLGKLVDCQIHVPSFDMGVVESIHVSMMHYIVMAMKEKLRGLNKDKK